jgi:hypothetical protein
MEIKQKLLDYTKSRPELDYPTYKKYALMLLNEIPYDKALLKYMKKHLKAKDLIDKKYNELLKCNNENDRIKEIFKEEEIPKPKEKKKRRVSNIEELREEDESE